MVYPTPGLLRPNTLLEGPPPVPPPPPALDTQTITTGSIGADPFFARGYSLSNAFGGIVDGSSNIYGGATIDGIYWDQNNNVDRVILEIVGIQANAGWTTMRVAGPNGTVDYLRADAIFSATVNTVWEWPNPSFTPATNPFGNALANVIVTFN